MKINILQSYFIVTLILLNFGHFSDLSVQCYRGDQNLMNTTERWKADIYMCAEGNSQCFQSSDLNEIIGLDGYDAVGSADTFRWVSATQTLAYIGYFENDADFAIAAANKAMVTHSNVFNFNKFIHANTEWNNSLYC